MVLGLIHMPLRWHVMGQLLYIVFSVIASLLCIVFFGDDRRNCEGKQKVVVEKHSGHRPGVIDDRGRKPSTMDFV
jgi:hypothetical protein